MVGQASTASVQDVQDADRLVHGSHAPTFSNGLVLKKATGRQLRAKGPGTLHMAFADFSCLGIHATLITMMLVETQLSCQK